MTIRDKLADRDRGILERRFIHQVLIDEGGELVAKHKSAITRLLDMESGALASAPAFKVQDTGVAGGSLTVTHLKRQRFLDMKTRTTKNRGKIRKKAYAIHNKVLYGHLNNIIRQLSFGFTTAVREKMIRDQTIDIGV